MSRTRQEVVITALCQADIPLLVEAFQRANWPKPAATFEGYLSDQHQGQRLVWVARIKEEIVGYITLKRQSSYPPFAQQQIPEIMDFNVLPPFQRQGIGRLLLAMAEKEATKMSNIVGLGVGLYQDYGTAQILYIKNGYIPDGKGVTYHYQETIPGVSYPLDDDLVLWFTKKLG